MTEQKMLQAMERMLKPISADLQEVKGEVQTLRDEVQNVKSWVIRMELHLENETDKGIKIIGEGHGDLMRKLAEALKVENEKELLLLRMNYLEGEIRDVKMRLSNVEKAKTA